MAEEPTHEQLRDEAAQELDFISRLIGMGWSCEGARSYLAETLNLDLAFRQARLAAVVMLSERTASATTERSVQKLDTQGEVLSQVVDHVMAKVREEFQPLPRWPNAFEG